MGCCGLTLYATTILAGIFTLIDCLLILPFDILLITFITIKNGTDITSNTKFAEFIDGFRTDSSEFKEHHLTVIILIGIKVGIRFVWLISAICLFIGNAREFRKFLVVWKYLTISRIIFAVAISIYAIVAFMEHLKKLFDEKRWEINSENSPYIALFTILIDFLELSPIWLILFIAFALFVHQRGAEIANTKERRRVDNIFGNTHTNGSVRENFSSIAHPVSLTQEPNPFIIANDNNNVQRQNSVPKSKLLPKSLTGDPHLRNGDPLKPVLEINDVICIPRASLKPGPIQTNVTRFENNNSNHRPHPSALAKRTSYMEYERDPNNVPKRNNSYNIAQTSGQRPRNSRELNSYDNKGFDYSTENNVYRPVLIKRASSSTKRNSNH